jgi:hypothetical protein
MQRRREFLQEKNGEDRRRKNEKGLGSNERGLLFFYSELDSLDQLGGIDQRAEGLRST